MDCKTKGRTSLENASLLYNQLLVVWNKSPYNDRQVSWLIVHRSKPPSRFPSGLWLMLPKYSDEFVQDSHLFPFSPDQETTLSYLTPVIFIQLICIMAQLCLKSKYKRK